MKKNHSFKTGPASGSFQRLFLSAFYLVCISFQSYAQQAAQPHPFVRTSDVFGTRCFIENKGQFDQSLTLEGVKVLYAFDNGNEKIFFTDRGPVYKLFKDEPLKEWEMEAMENGREIRNHTEAFEISVDWLGAAERPEVSVMQPVSHYFTFGSSRYNSHGYKKLIYNNVYPGLDVVYTLPDDQKEGVKYSLVVHPGANATNFRSTYAGAVKKIKLNDKGEIVVRTPAGDIIEHAPFSFYDGGAEVSSAFRLKDNIISFDFGSEIESSKTFVVDPWVTAITGLSSNNYAYDVDYDFAGNTYVYGGYNPFKISQYNSTGTLIWTFGGVVTSAGWNSAPIASQASNFAVNKYNSKSYIGQGYVNSGNRVVRIDATGNYDNFINAANNQFQEVWDMGFHCTTGEVFVLGGGTSSNISAVTINPTTAVINLTTFQPGNNSIAQDVVCHAIDDAGTIFLIYAGGSLTNKMCQVNSTFNGNVWTQPSGFNSFSEQGNKSQYQWSGNLSSNGFNCLAVNNFYLYYYDGLNLAAYNKTTGAQVANTTIPGQTLKRQGGIAVDDCNNLYLGGNGSILTYNFNGTNFNAQTPIPLASGTPTTYVYDIKLDKFTKLLYVGGSGFVGVYSPVNTLSCPTLTTACFSYVPVDFTICAGGTATVPAVNSASLSNPSYSIQPGGLVNSTGSFVVTPTITTSYTTFVTGSNVGNVVVTNSAVTTVSVFSQPSSAPTTTQSTCTSTINGFNLNLSWYPSPSTYSVYWSPQPNTVTNATQTASGSGVQAGAYTATILSTRGCSNIATFSINPTPEPGTFTVQPGAPYQLDCITTSINLNYVPAAFNFTTTSNLYLVNGPGVLITPSIAAGVHTVLSQNPNSGCTSSQIFVVSQNTAVPTSTITPLLQTITCSLNTAVTMTAYASPTTNVQHQWISTFGGTLVANTATSTYAPGPGIGLHCLVDLSNGCQTCKSFTVQSGNGFPTFSVTSPQSFTLGCSTRSAAVVNITNAQTNPTPGGSVTYTLLGPGSAPNYSPGANSSFTVTVPGIYTVITRDLQSSCETRFPLSILQNTFPPDVSVIVPTYTVSCKTPSTLLQASSLTGNVSYNWAFAGVPGNLSAPDLQVNANFGAPTNSLNGNYTITVTDNGNLCTNTRTIQIVQNLFPPKAVITGGNAISCNTESLVLTNLSTSNVPPNMGTNVVVIAYKWEGPSPQEPQFSKTVYNAYQPGIYTLTARDEMNGCTSTTTKTVQDDRDYPPVKVPAASPVVLECGGGFATLVPDVENKGSFAYSWMAPSPEFTTSATDKRTLLVNELGQYYVTITNTLNGCASSGYIDVINDSLKAGFVADVTEGFAPLTVNFNNTSFSNAGKIDLKSVWSFGTGTVLTTLSKSVSPVRVFTQPGTYSVILTAVKGTCIDSVMHIIIVEEPSKLEVPNVFTPNGDGVNDVFFLHTSNITEVYIQITDRWGHMVYELTSKTGNIAWDGKNQRGKEVPDGVYVYTLRSTGKDGQSRELHGNITLIR